MMQISPPLSVLTIMYYAALVYVLTGNDTIYKAISDNHSPDEKIALDVVDGRVTTNVAAELSWRAAGLCLK